MENQLHVPTNIPNAAHFEVYAEAIRLYRNYAKIHVDFAVYLFHPSTVLSRNTDAAGTKSLLLKGQILKAVGHAKTSTRSANILKDSALLVLISGAYALSHAMLDVDNVLTINFKLTFVCCIRNLNSVNFLLIWCKRCAPKHAVSARHDGEHTACTKVRKKKLMMALLHYSNKNYSLKELRLDVISNTENLMLWDWTVEQDTLSFKRTYLAWAINPRKGITKDQKPLKYLIIRTNKLKRGNMLYTSLCWYENRCYWLKWTFFLL